MSLSTLNFGHSTALITNHVLQNTTITGCACVSKKRTPGTNKYEVVMPNKSEFGFKFKIGGRRAALTVIDSVVYTRTGGQVGLGVIRKTHVTNTDITCNCYTPNNKKQVMHIGIDHKGELDHFNLSSAEDTLESSIPPTGPSCPSPYTGDASNKSFGSSDQGWFCCLSGTDMCSNIPTCCMDSSCSNQYMVCISNNSNVQCSIGGNGGKWNNIAPMKIYLSWVGVAALNGKIYAVGGSVESFSTASGEVYNPGLDSWHDIAKMSASRSGLGLAALNGKIYAVGGYDGSTYLNSGEAYDPVLNKWSPITPMSTDRSYLGLAALNGKIYAVGGVNDISGTLNSGEVYDPGSDSWSAIAPMTTHLKFGGLTALNGKIYAVGGHDGFSVLNNGEAYDPVTNTWSPIANMSTPRYGFGLAALNGKIYAFGGNDEQGKLLNSSEVYDPVLNSWSYIVAVPVLGNAASAAMNGKIYTIGNNHAEVYVPDVLGCGTFTAGASCVAADAVHDFSFVNLPVNDGSSKTCKQACLAQGIPGCCWHNPDNTLSTKVCQWVKGGITTDAGSGVKLRESTQCQ